MYTLRIIDQSESGAEERRNFHLGNNYTVVMKVPEKEKGSIRPLNRFDKALAEFYGTTKDGVSFDDIDESIVGIVYSERMYPIKEKEVVYIVNNEGKTVERVYGLYEKY